jgi:hypothetical protein
VPVEVIGEALLLGALVVAPWIYGSVEDSVRYALCAVLFVASFLFAWPDLRAGSRPRGLRFALAFPVLGLAQIVTRQTVAPWFTVEAMMVGFAMAMVWAVVDARTGTSSTDSGRRLTWGLLAVCASESTFAAVQWSTDKRSLFGEQSELQTMPFGSYVNHNNFAGLVSLGVPLALAMAIGDVRRSGKLTPRGLGLVGLACGLAISVVASGSRGGVLALIGGLFVLALLSGSLLKRRAQRRSWLLPMAVGLALVAIAAVAVPTATRTRLMTLFDASGSVGYRIDIAIAGLKAFASQPVLGSGLGAFADAAAPFKSGHGDVRSERAEADLVEFLVEGGLALVLLLVWFARFAWRETRREITEGRGRSGRWLRAGAVSACATMLFHSLFDFGFRIPANALAFAVLLGIATAAGKPLEGGRARGSAALVVLLTLAAAACAYRSLGAAGERAALGRATPESRLDALDSLVDAHPYLDRARRQRGLSWMALAYSHGSYDPTRLGRARADLEVVVALRPQWGEAWADLAWVKYYAGQGKEALGDMRRARELDPTHMGVGIAYAQVLAWSGDVPAAMSEVARLRGINPGWSRASARELAASWTASPGLLSSVP